MSHFRVDLVFNAFNEIGSIEKDLNLINFLCSENNVINRVYVIEDGSTDGTSEKLKELSDKYNLSLSQSEERRGYSNALIEGLSISKSEYIFFSDLGGKFDWSEVNNLIGKLPDNDLVIGVRKHRNDQKYRRLLTYLYSRYILFFYGIKSNDPDSGFRIYKRSLIGEIMKSDLINKHLLNSELTVKCIAKNCNYAEVPIKYFQRKGPSRGMPLSTIPKVIFSTIKNSFRIKKQINEYR
tara:strand:+ start:357 stop:1070 length:714 start_codon:yes stop_codon:yes gene_type:complete